MQNRRKRISYKYRKVIQNDEKDWIIVEDTHEPLVDKKKWEFIQRTIVINSHRNEKINFFLLDGLLKCYECGRKIGVRTSSRNSKKHMICNYYRAHAKLKVCTSHGFCYDYLEEEVLYIIKKIFENIDKNKLCFNVKKRKIKENTTTLKDKKKTLENEINIANSKLEKIYVDLLNGKITEKIYDNISKNLNNEIKLKENDLTNLTKGNKIEEKERQKDISEVINEFLNKDYSDRKTILRLINRLEIHQDKQVDIYFNFKGLSDFAPALEGCKFKFNICTT